MPRNEPPSKLRRRIHSMRVRVFLVVLFVVLMPLVLVWVSPLGDRTYGLTMREAATLCVNNAMGKLEAPDSDAAGILYRTARSCTLRLRLIRPDGTLLHDANHDGPPWPLSVIDQGFDAGPEPASLMSFEAHRPPLAERPELQVAARDGQSEGCVTSEDNRLLVCHVAQRFTYKGAPAILYGQRSSRRTLRALRAQTLPLLKLTLMVLVFGLFLSWALGSRIVRPVEELHRQVRARLASPRSTEPIESNTFDEVGDLGRAFDELFTKLAERNQSNEAFIADLAHEMKNPVAAVRAAAESLGRGNVDDARAARLERVLTDSSRRLDAVVTRFLELARAEAGLANEEREQVDVAALAQGLMNAMAARLPELSLVTELEPAVVTGAPERLETALRNLLENAASFAGEGGTVMVSTKTVDGVVHVRVQDDGPGIAPEDIERVFERFFTTRAGDRGTGLGLALVRAVVEAHDGAVGVESTLGDGATFTLTLPSQSS